MNRVDSAIGWSLGLWFVFGLVPVVGQSVGWHTLLNHQGLAAWVQAIGSMGAIFAAFRVANAQNERAERDRRAERAAPVAMRAQLLSLISLQVSRLIRPSASEPGEHGLPVGDGHYRDDESVKSRLKELGGALLSISLTDAGSADELVVLTYARGEFQRLLGAVGDMMTSPIAANARLKAGADWFLQHGYELGQIAEQIRSGTR